MLFFSFYLLSVVGVAYATLACSCVGIDNSIELSEERSCDSGCSHSHASNVNCSSSYDTSCCSDDHSININVYAPLSFGNAQLRHWQQAECDCAIIAQEMIDVGDFPLSITNNLVDRQAPFVEHPSLIGLSLRAPPVLV